MRSRWWTARRGCSVMARTGPTRGWCAGLLYERGYANLMFAGTDRGTANPAGLLQGTGKRHVKLRRVEDVANSALRELLNATLALT